MTIDIDKLNEAELIDLNRRVVARLNFLQQMRAYASMSSFSVGDRVTFQATRHPLLPGIITKCNRRAVTVLADTRRQWNITPSLWEQAAAGEVHIARTFPDKLQCPKG